MPLTAGQIVTAIDADHIESLTPAAIRTILGVAPSSDTAYDATSWNTNTDVPTKNAVRDKFESLTIPVASDTAYDATSWDANTDVPTKNAVRDKIEDILDGVTFTGDIVVPDEAYDATAWNGSLEVPTKNAVRDKIESLVSGIGGSTGATDNAILRADGTGGATAQSSPVTMNDAGSMTLPDGQSITIGAGTIATHSNGTNATILGGSAFNVYLNNGGGALLFQTSGTSRAILSSTEFALQSGVVLEGTEQTAPAAPAANGWRLYGEDNGSGKTRLMVLFATGAAQQVAIQP